MILATLKSKRQEAEKTMQDMGKILNISKVAYWKIEHGKTKISLESALKISKALNVDVNSLFLPSELTKEEQNTQKQPS